MKKNKMMRIASVLLVAVILTTCAISGTYAKYVTSNTNADSARVAKFGVKINAAGTLFAKQYDTHDSVFTETYSVISSGLSDDDKVVAPGTSGSLANVTVTGTPEVAVRVTNVANVTLNDNWKDANGDYYCPLEITVGSTTVKGLDYPSTTEFARAIKTAIDAEKADYPANTNLSVIPTNELPISWAWNFSTSAENDVKDTYLGDQADLGNTGTISISITTTVTQID